MIRIVSRQEGFRRCGIAHSVAPTDYPDEQFTADELERLLDEPMLVVVALADADDEIRFGVMAEGPNIIDRNLVGADSSAIDNHQAGLERLLPDIKDDATIDLRIDLIESDKAIDSKTAIDESTQGGTLKTEQEGETIELVIGTRPDDSIAGEQIQSESGDFDPVPEAKPAKKPAK